MNRIADLGDRILEVQRDLGLKNPDFFSPGINPDKLGSMKEFSMSGFDSELFSLFAWKNGATLDPSVPMKDLWLVPGFYLLPFSKAIEINKYLSKNIEDYSRFYYPLTSSGSSNHHFVDLSRKGAASGKVSVFYYDPEGDMIVNQIYDDIEAMFSAILECYMQNAFYVGLEGYLKKNAQREAMISREYNPKSEYWRRDDLF